MTTAPNYSALKRRLDRYFWDNNSGEMQYLQATLATHFQEFDRIAVIGGLVRDFALAGRSGFRSDIDLVIDAPRNEVDLLAKHLHAIPNRFGGYGCKEGPWKIDFWALETTWGGRHVPIQKLEDIVSSTFFDWDAVAYDLLERKLICADGYLERIKQRILDINLRPNPSPMGNLVRAIRRLVIWQASPGVQLKDFIDEHLDDGALKFVQNKEIGLFNLHVSTSWHTLEQARKALFQNNNDKAFRQLEFGFAENSAPISVL